MAEIYLVLDLEGKAAFDVKHLRECLKTLPGVRNWDENDARYPFFFEFGYSGDSTIVHMLTDDLQFISIEGQGDASLQVALKIQQRYNADIHAVDPECSFDLVLSKVSSLSEFKDKIQSGMGRENFQK